MACVPFTFPPFQSTYRSMIMTRQGNQSSYPTYDTILATSIAMSQTHIRRGFSLPGYNLEVHSYRNPSVHMCGLGSGTQRFTCENRSVRSDEGSAELTQQDAFVPDCEPLTGVHSFFPVSVRDGLYPWAACSTLAGCTFTERPSMLAGGGLSYPVTLVFSQDIPPAPQFPKPHSMTAAARFDFTGRSSGE